jgi:hypothetical protein
MARRIKMFKVKEIGTKIDESGKVPTYDVYDIHLDRSKLFNDQEYIEFLMYKPSPVDGKIGWCYYLAEYFEPV